MKSVLIVALVGPGYSAKPLMDAFLNNGFIDVRVFDYQLHQFSSGKDVMERMLIEDAKKMKPDLVWMQIQGSDRLTFATFRTLSKIAFTVNYSFDIRSKEQTEWLYALAPHLGLICFSNQRDVDECNSRGYKNTMCLQSSADMEVYKPGGIRSGVVFIGNNFLNTNIEFPLSKDRAEMVAMLQENFPDQFKVYGNNWGIAKLIGQEEEIKIYQTALIGINQNNFDVPKYTSDRIWRLMGCGVLCLTKYFVGIEDMFIRYHHLDWWETLDELKTKLAYYLKDEHRAKDIAFNGMNHVRTHHTWTARVKEMMSFIKKQETPVEVVQDPCLKAGAHVIGGIIPQAFDEQFDGKPCDCGRLRGAWRECNCGNKEFQFRWEENI
jgi:hypothetical protein